MGVAHFQAMSGLAPSFTVGMDFALRSRLSAFIWAA